MSCIAGPGPIHGESVTVAHVITSGKGCMQTKLGQWDQWRKSYIQQIVRRVEKTERYPQASEWRNACFWEILGGRSVAPGTKEEGRAQWPYPPLDPLHSDAFQHLNSGGYPRDRPDPAYGSLRPDRFDLTKTVSRCSNLGQNSDHRPRASILPSCFTSRPQTTQIRQWPDRQT